MPTEEETAESTDPSGEEAIGGVELTKDEAYAYEAPYPTGLYKAGPHVWPYLIPTQLPENEKL